ncbi:MAG: HupE/UreJ family protein [Cyanobacteriota bacterium]
MTPSIARRRLPLLLPLLPLPLLLLPMLAGSPALAHGSSGAGLGAGLLHPLLGLDHLAMLIAVGASAACLAPQLLLWAGAGAVLGAGCTAAGASLPGAELLAALGISLVALPLLVRGPAWPTAAAGVALAAAVAGHTLLHGQAAPSGAASPLWWLGGLAAALAVSGLTCLLVRRLARPGRLALGRGLVVLGAGLSVAPALALFAG